MKIYNIALTLLICSMMFLLSGCGPVIGIIADILPKPDVPAEYDTAGQKVVVFVYSQNNGDLNPVFVRELTVQLSDELEKNQAVADTVDYSEISDFKLRTSESVTPEMLGKEFKTDSVIVVNIDYLTIDYQSSEKMEPGQVLCIVSVVDGKTGQRLWPYDQLNKTYMIHGKLDHDSPVKLTNSRIIHDLAQETAIQLAKLFYLHKAD